MRASVAAAVLALSTTVPLAAKSPSAEDQKVVSELVARIYTPYTKALPDAPADGSYAPENAAGAAMDGYEPPLTASLRTQLDRWSALMGQAEEVYILNDFDWYCQCQDNDPATARIVSQNYQQVAKDRIEAKVLFSPGSYEGRDSGAPLIFRFRREAGVWKLDDLKFSDFTTLRKGLAADIRDASRDLAKKK
jgi:hypothetical protein